MILVLIPILNMLLILDSCNIFKDENVGSEFQLNEEFYLQNYQQKCNFSESLCIEMDSVLEDSRCPLYYSCKWEGNAKVRFVLKYNDEKLGFVLDSHPMDNLFHHTFTYKTYNIKMILLEPYPQNTDQIPQKDYKTKIIVSKT